MHRPSPARRPALLLLSASPSLLLPLPLPSLCFSFSPHLLLSFLLLPLPLSLSSYLIPLVFLLSACPADLHARCVEAAQLDLMPPATRSRAVSGPGAALPRAGTGRCSVHPPPWPTLWPLSELPFALHPLTFPSTSFTRCCCPYCCLLHLSCWVLDLCARAAQISSSLPGWLQEDGPKPCSQPESWGLVCCNRCHSHGFGGSIDLKT